MGEWRDVPLRAVATHYRGYSYSSSEIDERGEDSFISLKVFGKGGGFREGGVKRIRAFVPERFRAPGGSLLLANTDLTRDADVVGTPALVPPRFHNSIISMDATRVVPDPEQVDERYLALILGTAEARSFMRGSSAGSTVLHLDTKRLDVLPIRVPPLEEQRRIAEILDTIDETIQATERVIAKLRTVRVGVVADLLRPDREWLRASVGEVLLRIESGRSPETPDRRPGAGEWGVLKVSAVHPAGFRPSESKVLRADQVRAQDEVRPGDVLVTRANTPQLVGMCCFVDSTPQRLQLSDKTLRLVPSPNVVPRFLALTLQSSGIRRQIERDGTGSSGSMKNISQAEIRALWAAWPSVERQISITETVQALDLRLAEESAVLSKLRRKRSGLAADLLSGRVRTVAV